MYIHSSDLKSVLSSKYTGYVQVHKYFPDALLFAEHGENMLFTKIVLNVRACNSMNNLLSYRGLVDAKIRASDKDLPVLMFRLWN